MLRLEGRLDEATMMALNARVQLDRENRSEVAADFVNEKLGAQAVAIVQTTAGRLLELTAQHLTLVAESPPFSWHSSEPPTESPAALAAYATLVETLERLGWEPDGAGETWFGGRFQRTISVTHRVTV